MGNVEKITPGKSAEIFAVLFKCQLPYEMLYCLNECVVAATEELCDHYQRPSNTFDAEIL